MSLSAFITDPLAGSLVALASVLLGTAGAVFAFRQERLARRAADIANSKTLDEAWNLLRGKTGSKQVVLRLVSQGPQVEARQILDRVAATRRLSEKYYHVLGLLLECEQRSVKAAEAYQEGIRLFGSAVCHVNLGTMKGRDGHLGEALNHFDAALAIQPAYTFAHCCRGWILGDMGRVQEGIDACSTALSLEPNNALAHNNLGWLLEKQGDYAPAERHARRGLALDSAQPHIWETLGSILMKQGRLEEAATCFRRGLDFKPDYILPMRKLIICLRRMGLRDQANAMLDRLREARAWSPRTDQPVSRRN